MVKRRVNEGDSDYFFKVIQISSLFFFFRTDYLSSVSFSISLLVLTVYSSDGLFYCFICIVWFIGFRRKKKREKMTKPGKKIQLGFKAKLIQALDLSSGRRLFKSKFHHEIAYHPSRNCSSGSTKRRIWIPNVPFYPEELRSLS